MSKRLLDYDPFTGIMTWHDYDEADDKTIIGYSQDVEPILEANKRDQNDGRGRSPSGDLRCLAEIPPIVQLKWLAEDGIDVANPNHLPAVIRKLNDPDWRHLRVDLGRL